MEHGPDSKGYRVVVGDDLDKALQEIECHGAGARLLARRASRMHWRLAFATPGRSLSGGTRQSRPVTTRRVVITSCPPVGGAAQRAALVWRPSSSRSRNSA
jgi:hypothetical protein